MKHGHHKVPRRAPLVSDDRTFENLEAVECWRLVGEHGIGRVVFEGDMRTEVVPTRYDARSRTAYFRAPTYGELARRVHRRTASLQVDDIDEQSFTGWSIVMAGTAPRVDDAATIGSLGSVGRPRPWVPGPETQWIALPVDTVRGQRVST